MWYYAQFGRQRGPISETQLKVLIDQRQLVPSDLVWREGMANWQPLYTVVEFRTDPNIATPPPLPPDMQESKRVAAGVLALVLGGLGVHKFYLGMNFAGIIMLLGTVLTCGFGALVVHTIAIIEGLIYLTKSDAQFYEDYILGQRQWF